MSTSHSPLGGSHVCAAFSRSIYPGLASSREPETCPAPLCIPGRAGLHASPPGDLTISVRLDADTPQGGVKQKCGGYRPLRTWGHSCCSSPAWAALRCPLGLFHPDKIWEQARRLQITCGPSTSCWAHLPRPLTGPSQPCGRGPEFKLVPSLSQLHQLFVLRSHARYCFLWPCLRTC